MLIKKILTISVIAFATGCASSDGLEQQVNSLSQKVNKLTTEVSKLKVQQDKNSMAITELKAANEETKQRIDNVAKSYTK